MTDVKCFYFSLFQVRKSSSVTSTGSSSVPSLCSIPSSQQHPTEVTTSDLPVPEVTAQTPSGTVFSWEDLMEVCPFLHIRNFYG